MVDPEDMANTVKDMVSSFEPNVDGWPVVAKINYVDISKLPNEQVTVSVYCLTVDKEKSGAGWKHTFSVYVLIEAPVDGLSEDESNARVKAMVNYRTRLDRHFEGVRVNGGAYITSGETQFLWHPNQLNQKGRYLSLIHLNYMFKA